MGKGNNYGAFIRRDIIRANRVMASLYGRAVGGNLRGMTMKSTEFFVDEIQKAAWEIDDLAKDIVKASKEVCVALSKVDDHGPNDDNLISMRAGIDRIEEAFCQIVELHDHLGVLEAKLGEIRDRAKGEPWNASDNGVTNKDFIECN